MIAQARPQQQNKRRIVVVDDNQDAADTLVMLLQMDDFDVEAAYDGEEGLKAVQRLRPSLVILDINMPGKDGLDVARQLRQDRRHYYLIALSANVSAATFETIASAGFDEQLAKPARPEKLLSVVRRFTA